MRHSVHALFRVTALAALLLAPLRAGAEATPDPDEAVDQITQMNRDAVTAFQAKKFEDARKILKQALDLASSAGLDKHPIKARTHIHFGIVAIAGFKQRELGIKQFKKAIEIQSDIGLTKALVTPELTDAFNEGEGWGDAAAATVHAAARAAETAGDAAAVDRTGRLRGRPGSRARVRGQAGQRHLGHRRREQGSRVREDDPRVPPRGGDRVPRARDEGSRGRPLRRRDPDQRNVGRDGRLLHRG
jgi:hypothetical protein